MSSRLHLKNNVELLAARAASAHPAYHAQAGKALALVESEVARMYSEVEHVPTGHYASSIRMQPTRTTRGVTDYVVCSTDPQAHIIEWGFITPSGRWEPGKYVFTRALLRGRFGGA